LLRSSCAAQCDGKKIATILCYITYLSCLRLVPIGTRSARRKLCVPTSGSRAVTSPHLGLVNGSATRPHIWVSRPHVPTSGSRERVRIFTAYGRPHIWVSCPGHAKRPAVPVSQKTSPPLGLVKASRKPGIVACMPYANLDPMEKRSVSHC